MERDLKNKVVVVTGGAQGIGYEISDQFLRNGAKTVIVLDIDETVGRNAVRKLNDTYGDGKAVFITCDVTKDLDKVSKEIFKKYQVDVLVNNAGILDETNFRKTIEINCIAVVEWGMKFWEYMRTDKGGRGGTIYNIASIYGFMYNQFGVFYKTSKHAVVGFSRSLGHPFNYQKSSVRVIAICPGFTDTAILKGKIWDWHVETFSKTMEVENKIQKLNVVGDAAVEIFKVADSGTVWVKKNDEPIELAPLCQ